MKFTIAMQHNWLLKKIPNSNYWVVSESFVWYLDYCNKKHEIRVPKGFKTNFGSIPKPLRAIFNPTRYISYILHDWGYSKLNKKYTRKDIDLMLLEALRIEWASATERSLVYLAVRYFWWLFFNK